MTDHNLTNLPTLDLLEMLYSAQANYANAQSDREPHYGGGCVPGSRPVFSKARHALHKLPT